MPLNLIRLTQQLIEFGLNPGEWRVEFKRRIGPLSCLSIHARDGQAPSFEGWAVSEDWVDLVLCAF
jgi:hypothetical protein